MRQADMPSPRNRLPVIHIPARLCADVGQALALEWLVTNGIGGFASGTVAGALTRRYHGLLIAALRPPVGRMFLVAKLDETVSVGETAYPLHTNYWRDGVGPNPGCRWLRRFDRVLGIPTWTYELPDARRSATARTRLIKRIWMEPGQNITYVRYDVPQDVTPLELATTVLANTRDYHHLRYRQDCDFEIERAPEGLRLRARAGGPSVLVQCHKVEDPPRGRRTHDTGADWSLSYDWYRDFRLPVEEARGYDYLEDHLCVGRCRVAIEPGSSVTFVLSAETGGSAGAATALQRVQDAARANLRRFRSRARAKSDAPPPAIEQLVLAADQFLVARGAGHTVIAGYPWFTDWGRDTMIALPGLTLCTGRFEVAREILRTWARYVDRGMIPNRFPDQGDTPEYHTADATLWYLWAIDQYVRATGDHALLAELFPVLAGIVAWHRRGTRHHIRVGDDGLVYAGEEGVNLTWMDAKFAGRVITPRMGKPVELNALWYDALCNLVDHAEHLGRPGREYRQLAARARASFGRFWNPGRECCFDVLDGPGGDDATLRPNQIFAVSLAHSPLSEAQQRAVVATCERELLTWFGLRSLGPRERDYRGRCEGDLRTRDEAYHQGTVWGWLLGPFVIAHYRVYRDGQRARWWLEPMLGQLWGSGVGTLSEVFDGDPPHEPRGCFAQAWSVAETLRAWQVTQQGGGA